MRVWQSLGRSGAPQAALCCRQAAGVCRDPVGSKVRFPNSGPLSPAQIIFFGREKCPAQRHDPVTCPICSWAAVPPYDRAGNSPIKANGKKPGGSPSPKRPAAKGKATGSKGAAAAAAQPAATKRAAPATAAAAKRTRRSASVDE